MKYFCVLLVFFIALGPAAKTQDTAAVHWADSVYSALTVSQRIAQLMVVRISTMDPKTKTVTFFEDKVGALVKDYDIGAVCLFQGGPVKQAMIMNGLQQLAKTPMLVCMDAEWGVGMRLFDSVAPLPRQMMLGAMRDPSILYRYGGLVAAQCKRFGVQVNFAPVIDVNNNPDNPVINDRSFGEDKYKVAAFGIQYMKGMQDAGVMACAKHFPGHGDVNTDSHYDLPVINKSFSQLDTLELYPFKQIFAAGIGSVMTAHLYIPAIDSTPNRATSLSAQSVTGLMRGVLNYDGLSFTDALEMQGVKKYFPEGEAAVQALIAGNDMLLLPDDVPLAIAKIKTAMSNHLISDSALEAHCKKLLIVKYKYGLANLRPVNTTNLTADLNVGIAAMRRLVAEHAITLVARKNPVFFPLRDAAPGDVAYIGFGISGPNEFAARMQADHNAALFFFNTTDTFNDSLLHVLKGFKKLVIGIHNLSRFPANNFGVSQDMVRMITALQQNTVCVSFLFANAYAAKNICAATDLVVCYEDDPVTQSTAADLLDGKIFYHGVLPVTVCNNLRYGSGIQTSPAPGLEAGISNGKYLPVIDSIANGAIAAHATPGCVVLALKNGKILFQKAYGRMTYEWNDTVSMETVYDLASVAKICATTLVVMKLYEEGKLNLHESISHYLPETIGTDKADIPIEQLLIHEAGLAPFIPFYKETLDATGKPSAVFYSSVRSDSFPVAVAKELFIRAGYADTMYSRLLRSKKTASGKYVYSDNDFIFLAKVCERLSGRSIDKFTEENFYGPMQLRSIGYLPLQRNNLNDIAPTENDVTFRGQLLRGYVHDPGAAMWGGVAGHAGVFSNAYDLASVMQMLLNGGLLNGTQYLKKETIDLFTAYHRSESRRGYGFDKPEKDNATRAEPYPAAAASPLTFGHLGFTGTAAWADPAAGLVYIFLSNRLYPAGSDLLQQMHIRGKIMAALYEAAAE